MLRGDGPGRAGDGPEHGAADFGLLRPRLQRAVLSTAPGGLCLVVAPRGYGATTAVAQALGTAGGVIWVDAVPSEAGGDLGPVAHALGILERRGEQTGAGTDRIRDEVLAELARRAPGWLVLDGVCRDCGAASWAHVRALAERLPAGIRLVVIAADEPPASVIALTARRGSTLITVEDLRCTPDEALELLQRAVPGIDIDAARTITEAAEGWITALAAAAAQVKSERADAGWLSHRGADVLFDDTLAALPEELRTFLLDTSVLELLSGDVAGAVAGRDDAAELLLRLATRLLPIFEVPAPRGHTGRWWRRHGLLSRALRSRTGPARTEQHRRAAEWFRAAGDGVGTMNHLLASGLSTEAGRYLTAHEVPLITAGHADEVLGWYQRLPGYWGNEAEHLLRVAWGQALSGSIAEADAALGRLDAVLAQESPDGRTADPDRVPDTHGERDLLEAYLAGFHADPATMVASSRRANDALLVTPQRLGSQLAPLLIVRGLLWSGQHQAALTASDAVMARPYLGDSTRQAHRNAVRSLALEAVGRVREARVLAERADEWLVCQGLDSLDVQFMPVAAALARARLGSAQLREAAELAGRLAEAAQRQQHRGQQVEALLILATASAAAGDLGESRELLGQAGSIATKACPESAMAALIDEQLARVWIAAGDPVRAQRLAQRLPPRQARSLLLGRINVNSQPVGVIRGIESLQPATPRLAVERHLLLASAHLRSSRRIAQAHLRQGGTIAWHHGMALALVGADARLVALARSTASETQDDALTWLLQCRSGDSGRADCAPSAVLSRGELQLLSLLPARPRYSEMATELGVSVNTVKTRLRKLYAKLGAGSRDEAVALARGRGLLPSE